MKIGLCLIDISPSDGGIFQYSIYLLKMLVNCEEVNTIYLFYSENQSATFAEYMSNNKIRAIRHRKRNKMLKFMQQTSEFCLTRYYMRIHKQKYNLILYKLLNPERTFFNRYKIDLLHVPRQHSPAYRLKFPVVITMHDIIHFHYPEFFTSLERVHKAIRYHVSFKEADRIIVSYDHVKEDVGKYFKEEAAKTSVCPVPLRDDWITVGPTDKSILKEKYKIPEKFILTPAATWQHKNHLAVLEALSILKCEGLNVFWIATGLKTPHYETIEKRINELNLENQVLFTDVVSDSDLKGFYLMAGLVVIPTFYEAGSGPLIEAMRYEIPVICSNVTSLPGVIGNHEFIFKPDNIAELATLIRKGLTDNDFIRRNKENSKKQTELLRNINYTEPFVKAFKETIEGFKMKK